MAYHCSHSAFVGRLKPKKSHSSEEWVNVKPLITHLYCEQDMTLNDVMDLMRQNYQFDATIKMYKSHITAWGLRKNNRVHEAQAIWRRYRLLEECGQQGLFLVRGRLVDLDDIERCCKRAKAAPADDDAGQDGSLPEGVQCVIITEGLTTINDPDTLKHVRSFLRSTAVYIDSCFDRGVWRPGSDDSWLRSCSNEESKVVLNCEDDLMLATSHFSVGQSYIGGAHARRAFATFSKVLTIDYENTLRILLRSLARIQKKRLKELESAALMHLARMAKRVRPHSHPFLQFFNSLRRLAGNSIQDLFKAYLAQHRDLFGRHVGKYHYECVRLELELQSAETWLAIPWQEIWRKVAFADNIYGENSNRSIEVLHKLGVRLWEAKRWTEAEVLFRKLVQRHEQRGRRQETVLARLYLGLAEYHVGKYRDAKATWINAFRIESELNYGFVHWGVDLIERLVGVCRKLGDNQEADEYQARLDEIHRKLLEQDEMELRRDGIMMPQLAGQPPAVI